MKNLYDVIESILDAHDLGELTDDVKFADTIHTIKAKIDGLKDFNFVADGDKLYWEPKTNRENDLVLDFSELKISDLNGYKLCGACKLVGKKIIPHDNKNGIICIHLINYSGKLSDIIHKDMFNQIQFKFMFCQISDIEYLKCLSMEFRECEFNLSKINNFVKYISVDTETAFDLVKKTCHAKSVNFYPGDTDYIEITR